MKTYEQTLESINKKIEIQKRLNKKRRAVFCASLICICLSLSTALIVFAPKVDGEPINPTPESSSEGSESIASSNPRQSTPNNAICDRLGSIAYNGDWYVQITYADEEITVTPDVFIGYAHEFYGAYKDSYNELPDLIGKVYTVKEDADLLYVELSNGGKTVLKKVCKATEEMMTVRDNRLF